jgi:gas vesicle protein
MNSKTKLIIGALAVVALGAVTAALLGTKEGRRTKRELGKKARKIRNKTLQQVGELKVSTHRGYETAKQAVNDVIDEGKEIVSNIVGSADNPANAK